MRTVSVRRKRNSTQAQRYGLRIKNNDNSNLPAAAAAVGQAPAAGQIALINYPIASLFKQLDVFLNNDLVSSTDNYGLKSYVETLANFWP